MGIIVRLRFIIVEGPDLPIEITGTSTPNTGSNNGSVDITVTGGTPPYTYSWIGPNGEIFNTEDIDNLVGGIGSLTVTDDNGCIDSIEIEVEIPGINIIDFANICFDTGFILAEIDVSGTIYY